MLNQRSNFSLLASPLPSPTHQAAGQSKNSHHERGLPLFPRRGRGSFSNALLTLLALFSVASMAFGQTGYSFPSSVNVGSPSATQSISVAITSTGTLQSIQVLTGGAQNLDYAFVSGCSTGTLYFAGATCTVNVTLTPRYPGIRDGAVVLLDGSNNVMGTQYLRGVGVGPLSVLTAGEITTVAGNGLYFQNTTTSNNATDASINSPASVAVDTAGNFYYTDSGNNRIGKVNATTDQLTYIAGSGGPGFSPDGTLAVNAQISAPAGIMVDGAGNVYFTETAYGTVREIVNATGKLYTVAGTGVNGSGADGILATASALNTPQGLALDALHNLYIADTGNNRIREVSAADGTITTIAGGSNPGFSGDGGPATSAQLNQPMGINFGPDLPLRPGSLYIADLSNNRVRVINSAGIISTVAGNGTAGYSGIPQLATATALDHPSAVALDAGGNLYISDSDNNVLRKVNAATNKIATLAGNGGAGSGGDGLNANSGNVALNKPLGFAIDQTGSIFIVDRLSLKIREIAGTVGRIVYSDIKVTNTSPPVNQALDNDGNVPLQLTSITPDTNAVIASTTCSTTLPLAPGAECTIAIEFKPASVGSPITGTVVVTSNAANSPDIIKLTGNSLSIEPSTTVLASTPNPSAFGQPVVFTATVSTTVGDNVTPRGTVQFFDGGTSGTLLGTVTLPNGSGSSAIASLTVSTLAIGSHTITAVYSGQAGVTATSTSNQRIQVVLQAPVLKLTSNLNPAPLGNPVIFTAQVVGGSNPVPTGTVTFKDTNGTTLDTEPLNGNAIATSNAISTLSAGLHTITAIYSGDSTYATSSATLGQTIQQISTSTTLVASANPSVAGTTVSFAVTVTAQASTSPNIPITGTVSLTDNGTPLPGSRPVAALGTNPATATVTVPVAALATGTHNIVAIYSGDHNYLGSSSSAYPQNVIRATSNVALTATPSTAVAGEPVTFTATVTGSGGTPGGTVNFSVDGGAPVAGTLTNGVATLKISTLPVGSHTVIATYLGDTNDGPATSTPASVTIVAATTSTKLTSSQNPLLTLSPVTITATVTNGGGGTPTGTISFSQDNGAITTVPLAANGTATLSVTSLSAGTHTFTASYSGDAVELASSAIPLSEVVQLRPTTDVLSTSATSLSNGQQITLISIVRWTGATTPTGTVTFFNGTQSLASAPVDDAGVATATVLLTGTSATLSSTYNGDAFYASSSSASDLVSIGPAANFDFLVTPLTFSLITTQHELMTVKIDSLQNFTDTLSLGCLGLPLAATCNFSKDQFLLPAGGSQTVTLIVDTANPLLGGTQAKAATPGPLGNTASKLIVACFLPGGLLLGLVGLRFRKLRSFGGLIMLALLLAGMSTALTGCGTVQLASTPAGVYNFVVTATGMTGVSQSIPVTMTVTPLASTH